MQQWRTKARVMTEVPRARTTVTAPSGGRPRRDRLRRRWPHKARVAPATTAVTRDTCYEGRLFGHPSVTNSFDPVASAMSSGDNLLPILCLCMRLLVALILGFFH
jgi:hypothetical protein